MKLFKKRRRSQSQSEEGVALILAVVVLTVLSVVIMGVSRDVDLDLGITRNFRLKHDAFNWAESGIDVAEEMIGYAIYSGGKDAEKSPYPPKPVGTSAYVIEVPGNSLYPNGTVGNTGTVTLSEDGRQQAASRVEYLGRMQTEGGSIIIASGYEGVGKSAAAGTGIVLLYKIETNGTSSVADGQAQAAEIYSISGSGY